MVLVLLAAGFLGGCGQKGPLYRDGPVEAPPAAVEPGVDRPADNEGAPG
ncbi:MAG: lipoprotein [Marinobacter sp.]